MARFRRFDIARFLDDDEVIVEYLRVTASDPDVRLVARARRNALRALTLRFPPADALRRLGVLAGLAGGERAVSDGDLLSDATARRRLGRWLRSSGRTKRAIRGARLVDSSR